MTDKNRLMWAGEMIATADAIKGIVTYANEKATFAEEQVLTNLCNRLSITALYFAKNLKDESNGN